MKKALLLSVFAVLTMAQARTLEQIKASGTIKIATEGAYPPFNFYKGKVLTGFEVDLANAMAKQMGLKVEWIAQPFDSLLIGLAQNRYDFVIASHGITPERAKAVDFSNPHYCSGGAIVAKVGGPKTPADLKGKVVAVQVGTSYLDNVRRVAGVKEIKTYPKDTDALQVLMAGRVNAWVTDRFVALEAVSKNPKAGIKVGQLLFQEELAMAVTKGNTSLRTGLNTSLATLQKNGTYAKISKQYFGENIGCM